MLDELEGYLQENDIEVVEIAALTLPRSQSGGSSGCPGSEWDQGHLEFCTYGILHFPRMSLGADQRYFPGGFNLIDYDFSLSQSE